MKRLALCNTNSNRLLRPVRAIYFTPTYRTSINIPNAFFRPERATHITLTHHTSIITPSPFQRPVRATHPSPTASPWDMRRMPWDAR
jgi:hypothetical protein